jgi:hypothetical protein
MFICSLYCISICVAILTLIAGIYLLIKVKSEQLKGFVKWMSYIIVGGSLLVLLCQAVCGICLMTCCGDYHGKEGMGCHSGMQGGHGCMMMSGHSEMQCCDMRDGDKDECCDMKTTGDTAEHIIDHEEDAENVEKEEKK